MPASQLLVIFLALVFGSIAALMAYVITYEEYTHHFADKKRASAHGREAGLITLAVFLVLGFILAFLLPAAL